MKFFSILAFSGLVAMVSAIPQDAPSSTTTSLSPITSCLAGCDLTDITCQAACVGVPAPNPDMIHNTTACAANCKQGDGSAADTEAYGKCQQSCISSLFLTSTGASSAAATGESSGSAASASAATTGSGSSGSGTATVSGSSTATGSGASTSSSGAAVGNIQVGASAAGIIGLMLAALAM